MWWWVLAPFKKYVIFDILFKFEMLMILQMCHYMMWCEKHFFMSQLFLFYFTGSVFTILLLLASLNSCTNPWIYLAFSDNLHRQVSRCLSRGRHMERSSTAFDSESRMRSTMRSTTEVTRIEPVTLTDHIINSKLWVNHKVGATANCMSQAYLTSDNRLSTDGWLFP